MHTTTPIRAIREKCLACCDGSCSEIKACEVTGCPLYRYRFGKCVKRSQADEQREAEKCRLERKITFEIYR